LGYTHFYSPLRNRRIVDVPELKKTLFISQCNLEFSDFSHNKNNSYAFLFVAVLREKYLVSKQPDFMFSTTGQY
jgi:hypothetical protein